VRNLLSADAHHEPRVVPLGFESSTTGKGTTSVVPQKDLKKTGFSR
jgi:hypothetical protein